MPETHEKAGSTTPILVWFRDDLRVTDHPALAAAAKTGRPVICLYVLDATPALRPLGAAARWWLAGSLRALDQSLAKRGAKLVLRHGAADDVVTKLVKDSGATAVHWNR